MSAKVLVNDAKRGKKPADPDDLLKPLLFTALCGGVFCPSYSPPRPQKASEKNSVWKMRGVFLPPPIAHRVRAQASGKIASRKIVCSCERVRRFFFGETPPIPLQML